MVGHWKPAIISPCHLKPLRLPVACSQGPEAGESIGEIPDRTASRVIASSKIKSAVRGVGI
ncbi:hypothetical protein V0288_02075 [Pannus brasiliensis CCIBt3594]|uniref:Uncharacterized protein n=1 Tax=Pannus brasiliensis CCIBt3594 TaxID=1427578 RepID=A0AAW9QRH1_9CHRO